MTHNVRRNSKSGVFEDPMCRNSGNGTIEDPCAYNNPTYYTGNGVLVTVRKTFGSGVSEDPVRDYSTTGCFVEGSQMIH